MSFSLSRLFRAAKSQTAQTGGAEPSVADIAPDAPFVAIGDIHGCADLLSRLLQKIDPDLPIICVGDYVDRGDNTAQVIDILMARPDIQCLKGNHEVMLLEFLNDPVKSGARWLRCGGLQTLASFGLSGGRQNETELTLLRDRLADALGEARINWLTQLSDCWQSGNVVVTHAGADPAKSISDQRPSSFHWGHPDFLTTNRRDGTWVVYGHVIVDQPQANAGRIAIDTGAYATSQLTAVEVSLGALRFLTV